MGDRNTERLIEDIMSIIRTRTERIGFSAAQANESAYTLRRIGWNTLEAADNSEAPNRRNFFADVRKEGAGIYSYIIYLRPVRDLPPPKRGRNLQYVDFVVLSIPLAIAFYTSPYFRARDTLAPHARNGA